jgi:hypothetical protein
MLEDDNGKQGSEMQDDLKLFRYSLLLDARSQSHYSYLTPI